MAVRLRAASRACSGASVRITDTGLVRWLILTLDSMIGDRLAIDLA